MVQASTIRSSIALGISQITLVMLTSKVESRLELAYRWSPDTSYNSKKKGLKHALGGQYTEPKRGIQRPIK